VVGQQVVGLLRVSLYFLFAVLVFLPVDSYGNNKNRNRGQQFGGNNGQSGARPNGTAPANPVAALPSANPEASGQRLGSTDGGSGGVRPAGEGPSGPVSDAGDSPAPTRSPDSRVQLHVPGDLEDAGWGKELVVGLPGPIRAFIVSLLYVSRIPRSFPEDFHSSWAAKERIRPNPLDRIKQASLLKALLAKTLEIYDKPQVYSGGLIQTFDDYKTIVAPLEGDAENSFRQEFEHISEVLKAGVASARKVPIPSMEQGTGFFANSDVQRMARERETINRLFTKSMAMALLTRGSERSAATYIFEILMRSFASSLFANAGEPLAALVEEGLNILEGKGTVYAMPQQTQQVVPQNPYLRIGRMAVDGIRASSNYDGFQEAFFAFLRRFAAMDEESLTTVIEAFESALGEVVQLFAKEAKRMTDVNEAFANQGNRANQAAAITVFIERYPHLVRQDLLKDIILELLVLPVTRSGKDSDILGVILKYADPITQSLVQRGPRSAGLFEAIKKKLQSSNRKVPPTALKKILKTDSSGYIAPNAEYASVSLAEQPVEGEEAKVFDQIDPDSLGAGKFFVVHSIRDSKTGTVKVAKVLKPDSERGLEDGVEIATYLADELAQVVFGSSSTKDNKRLSNQVLREISSLSVELRRELDVGLTVANQREAYRRFDGRKITVHSEEGPIRFILRVPAIMEATPKSQIMVMDVARGIMPTSEFVRRHQTASPLAARVLFSQFFEELIFGPRMASLGSVQPIVDTEKTGTLSPGEIAAAAAAPAVPVEHLGFANLDGHTGNNPLAYLGIAPDGVKEYELWFIDWGLVTRLKVSDIDALLSLGFGGSINDPDVISAILWDLSNSGRIAKTEGLGPERQKELQDRKRQVIAYVKTKVRELRQNRQYWGPSEWIYNLWRHGLLDFPPNLARLQEGISAINETTDTLTGQDATALEGDPVQLVGTENSKNLIDQLQDKAFWHAIGAAKARFGTSQTWFKIAKYFVAERSKSCALRMFEMIGFKAAREYVDPNK
jgi:hypothetical protein